MVFRTDSEFRSKPAFFKAVSLVRTGKIGQLKTIRFTAPSWNTPLPMQPTMPVPPELDYDMWLGPTPLAPYTEQRPLSKECDESYSRPGWYGNRSYCDGAICNWGYHMADIVQWGNNSENTGPVEIEGHGEFPPLDGLWNVMLGWDVHYRYANGVEVFYANTGRTRAMEGNFARFEGTEGWVCGRLHPTMWRGAEVDFDRRSQAGGFPVPAEARETRFPRLREDSRTHPGRCGGGAPFQLAPQLGYIACQAGRKLKWDPAAERFIGDDEANRLACLPQEAALRGT